MWRVFSAAAPVGPGGRMHVRRRGRCRRASSLIAGPPSLCGAGCLPICDFVLKEDEGPTSIRKLNRARECAVTSMLHDLALAQTAEFHDRFQPQHLPRRFLVLLEVSSFRRSFFGAAKQKGRSGAVALRTTLWFASASEVTDGGSITIPVVSASSRGCLRLGDTLSSVTTPHGTEGRQLIWRISGDWKRGV